MLIVSSQNKSSQNRSGNQEDFMIAFDTFSSYVERAEREIRENAHRGRIPPICFGDPWDEGFASAYQALSPYLSKFRKQRYFPVPLGLAHCPTPIKAETALQALMFLLNPAAELFGEPGVLDTAEYKAIKASGMKELQELARRNGVTNQQEATKSIRSRKTRGSDSLSDYGEVLLAFLSKWHGMNTDEPNFTDAGTQKVIAKQLSTQKMPWSTSRVNRTMRELFANVRGFDPSDPMESYRQLCRKRDICSVLIHISLKPLQKGLMREFGSEDLSQFSDRGY